MVYKKAKNVLPDELIEMIQNYIDGECIYIPVKEGKRSSWGSKNGTRKKIKERNAEIIRQYTLGESISTLAKSYYLSKKSIEKIVYEHK
ncbi:CD3324 family protein [Bacillus spongiae]|uniref:CD3324 family protein n=1 Tax=Bacillus spongiae TaxID=2683610 RepID=A0ABU8HEG7_9BACI